MLAMYALWGMLGTAGLAAANIATTGMSFTLVTIYGLQQALYSLVPQAQGANDNAKA